MSTIYPNTGTHYLSHKSPNPEKYRPTDAQQQFNSSFIKVHLPKQFKNFGS